ncbi:hypothetical protein GOV06_00810 [Candidatus Woesearchaeota archaeon]|nr:hypothetical protein [Candidatus Woesearchaeota archaeon]
MDILEEIVKVNGERRQNIELYEQHKKDIEAGNLPIEKSGEESVRYETASLLKRLCLGYHLKELGELVLKDEDISLLTPKDKEKLSEYEIGEKEKERREKLKTLVEGLNKDIEGLIGYFSSKISQGYDDHL